jgi:hypothetical protein
MFEPNTLVGIHQIADQLNWSTPQQTGTHAAVSEDTLSLSLSLSQSSHFNKNYFLVFDRLCGLVVGVPGHRSRGSGSIPGATRVSEK